MFGISMMNEFTLQQQIRAEASQAGCVLWRNNVGAVVTQDNRFIRFGLANDSKQMNERIKSSDLIGIEPVIITEDMVGSVIGRFLAREVKAPGWRYRATSREAAQLQFLTKVNQMGGNAAFASTLGTIMHV